MEFVKIFDKELCMCMKNVKIIHAVVRIQVEWIVVIIWWSDVYEIWDWFWKWQLRDHGIFSRWFIAVYDLMIACGVCIILIDEWLDGAMINEDDMGGLELWIDI